ncbi:MAG TPA: aminotransferase class I/II-fold pyridoxal phosphate-dependent enzyme [Candidatus Solibacter sp.]|jgi:8-amino-7-oxononanoate synthase|nr:aminotransferase class I/II-fold pyridoxal phosphate-dependent enzyme [Candidatus Solibacter sp.]
MEDIAAARSGHPRSNRRDIFEKCWNFNRARALQEAGLYLYFETFGTREGCGASEITLGDRKILMFGCNDYLDLTNHPRVKEAAIDAIRQFGTGCSGSRLLNGTLHIHVRLEEELAEFVGKEAAIVLGTGFQANYAAIAGLAQEGDVILCEHNLHASLVDGALRSEARSVRFRHNDMQHLEKRLQQCEESALIVTESVFSMEGDMADLKTLTALASRYGARTYVDEAHGIGLFGPTGAGVAEEQGVLKDVDVIMGTFSKSLAAAGGFVASTEPVIHYLKHLSQPFVFSASIPPASVETVRAALHILKTEPERRQIPLRVAEKIRTELAAQGFNVIHANSPVVAVVIPDDIVLFQMAKQLLEEGIYVNPVVKPAATQNLLRISCTAAHNDAHAWRLVETMERLARRLNMELERPIKEHSKANVAL